MDTICGLPLELCLSGSLSSCSYRIYRSWQRLTSSTIIVGGKRDKGSIIPLEIWRFPRLLVISKRTIWRSDFPEPGIGGIEKASKCGDICGFPTDRDIRPTFQLAKRKAIPGVWECKPKLLQYTGFFPDDYHHLVVRGSR